MNAAVTGNPKAHYDSASIALHWLMVVLIAAVYACIELRVNFPRGSDLNESKFVADWAKELHEIGGTIGYVLIALHAAAALFHHYFVRDNTLRRILPH